MVTQTQDGVSYMIDTDKYERILKATYSTDSIRCDTLLAHGLSLLAEVKRLTEFRDKVLAAFIEMPRNSRSLTYLLNDEGYLKHYSTEDYLKGLHPHSLGLYELHEEWKEKAKQYLEDDE